MMEGGCGIRTLGRRSLGAFILVFAALGVIAAPVKDPAALLAGLEKRYAAVETATGNFVQTYRAPGVEQTESGVFWLKRPGLMRWEYRTPEEKLFVADGRESFLYVPSERQVTIQPLTPGDFEGTPLGLLLGAKHFSRGYEASADGGKPLLEGTVLLRLLPRRPDSGYDYLVLELDRDTLDIRRIVIREHIGNTSEFLLSNVSTNVGVPAGRFRFTPPRGVEVLRLGDNDRVD
ncbi:MAG: outer membrane lipoprotein chaperone LolA [Acidobacteria bacterium]|nr:outer membrane lipoprotein chaperone LolA [Acidobacteriota bacterium]